MRTDTGTNGKDCKAGKTGRRGKAGKTGRRGKGAGLAAFTLVESIVGLLAATLAILGIWAFFHVSLNHVRATGRRLAGVQGAQILIESLEHDLRRIFCRLPDHPVKVGRDKEGNAWVSFHIYDDESTNERRTDIQLSAIRYDFFVKEGRVTRRVGKEPPVPFRHAFERVAFGRFPHDGESECAPLRYLELPPYRESSGASLSGLPWRNVVTYQITCVQREVLKRPVSERRPQDRTTICGGILIKRKASSGKYHFWLPNLTSLPRRRAKSL